MRHELDNKINYCVAIRTLGTAGEKYKKLLDSIQKQTVKPQKIIIVLPEGYAPPSYSIGNEIICYSTKGMIPQRIHALNFIDTEYTLFCDDDVEFSVDFVEKVVEPLTNNEYACSSGPLLEFFPPKTVKHSIASILGGACVMLHGRENNYVRILKTGGWSYNCDIDVKSHKVYNTQSLAGTCFFANTNAIRKICFEDEMWAEKFEYAAFEDRIMFYKLLKNEFKTCVVSDALYLHNDGKTSTKELKLQPIYAARFNHYVFWHRYIYSLCKTPLEKAWAKICINYYMVMQKLNEFLKFRMKRINKEAYAKTKQGFIDAKKYVMSEEYKKLKPIVTRKE